ncbi:MHYT domain-containing protein [Phytoactinopolyspora endophytica]|uniref:MHYT domain-containing protein n=1 Tax=Phytoactinopolyspora endophytica TaxID=1642495 RepID=UPI00101C05A1|nr:MHYT domain-containing protein [Phytoactinopolyspora endophytica]
MTAIVAFVMACVGAGLGFRCLVRALDSRGATAYRWLLTAAVAIGSGIWTMHLIAILGFGVDGTPVRFDIPLTLLSLLVAVVVVTAGVFAVGRDRSRTRGVVLGGILVGIGIAGMHIVGMFAAEIHGTLSYDPVPMVVSVVIAVGVATLALMVAFLTTSFRGTAFAALLMGFAATAAEYTGFIGLQLDVTPGTSVLPGASAEEFIFPFIVVFGSFLFLSSAFVALSPIRHGGVAAATTPVAAQGRGSN